MVPLLSDGSRETKITGNVLTSSRPLLLRPHKQRGRLGFNPIYGRVGVAVRLSHTEILCATDIAAKTVYIVSESN